MINRFFALFVLLEALSTTANAAAPLPTNFIQNIALQLTVVMPGKMATNGLSATVSNMTVTAREAIGAIGEASSNKFSAKAQLVVVNPITYFTFTNVTMSGGKSITTVTTYGYLDVLNSPTFEIRDGSKSFDVSGFINVSTVNNTAIVSYAETKTFAYTSYKSYRIRTITVTNSALAFSGQGFVESPLVAVTVKPGVVVFGNNDDWNSFTGVADNGIFNGVLQGTISATFDKLE